MIPIFILVLNSLVKFLPVATAVSQALQPWMQSLAEAINSLFKGDLGPLAKWIGDFLQDEVLPLIEAFISMIIPLIDKVVPILMSMLDTLFPMILLLIEKSMPLLLDIIGKSIEMLLYGIGSAIAALLHIPANPNGPINQSVTNVNINTNAGSGTILKAIESAGYGVR
jgi:phage-related protein